MNVLIIDNYDSFTYNLYQYVGEILMAERARDAQQDFVVQVKRNDELSIAQVRDLNPDRIIISPGPGTPDNPTYFGICGEVIATLGKTVPLLGVCLGMQGIVHVFGGQIIKPRQPVHGKTSPIVHDGRGVFSHMPQGMEIMRYHSLIVDAQALPAELELTAVVQADESQTLESIDSARAEVMAVRHRRYPIEGIQFHPESFATEGGKDLLRNFLLR